MFWYECEELLGDGKRKRKAGFVGQLTCGFHRQYRVKSGVNGGPADQ